MFSVHPKTTTESVCCYHCGDRCPDDAHRLDDKVFCCTGCKTVYEILNAYGLEAYYLMDQSTPGIPKKRRTQDYDWLDEPDIREVLIDYADSTQTHLTFKLPQIHCSSCVWLLEQLYKLHPGILDSQVNFLRRRLKVRIDESQISLGELATWLARIGYAPEIQLQDIQQASSPSQKPNRRLAFQLGVAGFCFGNIMLLSFPEYLSLGALSSNFAQFFNYLIVGLSLPVLLYSARDYYASAFWSIRQGRLNMDVPITLGMAALFGRSLWENICLAGSGLPGCPGGSGFFSIDGKMVPDKNLPTAYI